MTRVSNMESSKSRGILTNLRLREDDKTPQSENLRAN